MTAPLNPAAAGFAMGKLYMRNTVLRVRSLSILALVGMDIAVAFVTRSEASDLETGLNTLTNDMLLGFVLPFMAMMYGIAVVRDEVEGGTLTYLLMRPISRATLYLGRLATAIVVVLAIVLGCTAAHIAILGVSPDSGRLARIVSALVLGSVCYTTLFAAIGAVFKRPFTVGLLALLLVDLPLSNLPMAARHVTMRANLVNIAGLEQKKEGLAALIDTQVAMSTSVGIVALVLALAAAAGIMAFQRREYTGDPQA